ncbi:HAD-IIA family hydrolase [Dietzia psychralcaliphila]|uniref:Haloacid dehalogenase n=1 Tax=Dietzia psychralcaliphila TaxID=139021 RepID=A0AAD0JPM3_9ACTN|nr:HAD-IIA family hydrolase [Dietzia psychralcaliphila]AWH95302.1 haloacid dehalogenase [Dietzia psychralcaliphila]PTM85536.1 HAD superfamily hydrolase (TIGR01450 family) [Dietzia psychralcaliphila]
MSAATLSDLYDALLVDLDGTLIRGPEPIPGAAEALDESGLPVVYVTNNASRSPADTAAHLRDLGFTARDSDVMTSAQAAVMMLVDHVDAGARVLVVGHDSFRDLARAAGYEVVHSADDHPEVVLQGLSRELTWGDLAEGCLAIRHGVPWVASNVDTTLPTERGLLPGNGSLVAALRAATDREPVVAGKPAAGVLRAAADLVGAKRPLVVGDRLDTDIEGALAAGMPALLVLTGVHGTADLLAADECRRATHLARDLSALAAPPEVSRIDSAPALDARVLDGVLHLNGIPETMGGVDLARSVIRQAWLHGVTTIGDPGGDARSRFADAGLVVG